MPFSSQPLEKLSGTQLIQELSIRLSKMQSGKRQGSQEKFMMQFINQYVHHSNIGTLKDDQAVAMEYGLYNQKGIIHQHVVQTLAEFILTRIDLPDNLKSFIGPFYEAYAPAYGAQLSTSPTPSPWSSPRLG